MTLIDDLRTEAVTRDLERGWTREKVKSLDEQRNPDLLKPYRWAYVSPTSVTIRDIKKRKVVGAEVSNGEVSRIFLKRVMGQALEAGGNKMLKERVPWRKEALQFLDRQAAYFFRGQVGGPFEQIDIRACYASLYTPLTIDLTYRPECNPPLLGLGYGSFPQVSEWMKAKGERNSLWGTIQNRHGLEWRYGQPIAEGYPNRFFAPDLRGFVFDCAHAIALEAITTFKALSWSVDGGVFRPGDGREFASWLFNVWGLRAVVKAESPTGWLFSHNSYIIGPVETEDAKKGRAMQGKPMSSVRRQSQYQRSWLADAMRGVA